MIDFNHISIILFILPAYQMSFYAVQLVTLRSKANPSRKPLGFLMLLMLIYILVNISRYLGYTRLYSYLHLFQLPVLLAVIPTYCLYFRTLTSGLKKKASPKSLAFCYLPATFILILNVISISGMSPDEKNRFLTSAVPFINSTSKALSFASITFMLGNIVFVIMQVIVAPIRYRRIVLRLRRKQNKDTAFLPYFENVWSHLIFVSVIGFVVINALGNFIVPEYNTYFSAILNVGILIFGSLAGYFGLKQDKLFYVVSGVDAEQVVAKDKQMEDNDFQNENEDSGFSIKPEEAKKIMTDLEHLLANDKPYLDSKLRVMDVARKIETSKHKLTYVINQDMGTNFYGLINKNRVLEAKRLLKEPKNQKYNLEVIAEMAGFQSKSSFNGCFKKITGVTPSTYRKNNFKGS